jgi:ABC-type transporter Mla MlaB component
MEGSISHITYSNGEFRVNNPAPIQLSGKITGDELPGVFCDGIQYFDLGNINSVNNTGMASLISLLKSLLKQGTETRFVNVNTSIQQRIESLGLSEIIKCV